MLEPAKESTFPVGANPCEIVHTGDIGTFKQALGIRIERFFCLKTMNGFLKICLIVLSGCTGIGVKHGPVLEVCQMQGFPAEEEGIEQGVSACYTGIHNGMLMMAGGCNFPEKPALEGGEKRFYQGIYVADASADSVLVWKKSGDLPMEAAYGVSISTPQGIICAGGTNRNGALSSVIRITLSRDGMVEGIDSLPSLPAAVDNMGGAILGNCLFIAGGNVNGVPSNTLYCLDLDKQDAGWVRMPDFPGTPRTQPVCVAQRKGMTDLLFLWGGFSGASEGRSATLSVDGYCYNPLTGIWSPIAVPMGADSVSVSLGGGAGIACGDSLILCTGGVNKDVFFTALKREEYMKKALAEGNFPVADSLRLAAKEYMSMLPEQYRFNDRILMYNTSEDSWKEVGRFSETARAGAVLAGQDNVFFNIAGELKPGIRTTDIVKMVLNAGD